LKAQPGARQITVIRSGETLPSKDWWKLSKEERFHQEGHVKEAKAAKKKRRKEKGLYLTL